MPVPLLAFAAAISPPGVWRTSRSCPESKLCRRLMPGGLSGSGGGRTLGRSPAGFAGDLVGLLWLFWRAWFEAIAEARLAANGDWFTLEVPA